MPYVVDSSELDYEIVSDTQTLSGPTTTTVTVQAPTGKVAVGGGGGATGAGFVTISSRPSIVNGVATGWTFVGSATDTGPWSCTAWAICIRE